MAGITRAGKNGKVVIGSTTMPAKSWKVADHTDALDSSSTATSGKRTYTDGLSHCDVEVDCEWHDDIMPFGSTPSLRSGTTTTCSIYALNTDTSPIFTCATTFWEDVDVEGPHDGTIKYNAKGKSSGSFTLDDGGGT